jgi:acetoin utilization protein AcuB
MAEANRKSATSVANPSRPLLMRQCMTPAPHSIGKDQPLAVAHDLMRKYALRHLPVLEKGKLVGILTERDLLSLEAMVALDPDGETVEDGMTQDVHTVAPDDRVKEVVSDMAANKHGSAVVVEHGKVVGIFTVTDALELLAKRL